MNSKASKYNYGWFIDRFGAAQSEAADLQSSADRQTLLRKPDPDTWSVAECIGHLNTFGTIYYDNIQQGMDLAEPGSAGNSKTFRPRLFWRGVIRVFEPPYRIPFKTLALFEPDTGTAEQSGDLIQFIRFEKLQHQFIQQLEWCRKHTIDLSEVKVGNPALPFIKMTLAESYAVAEAHQRRHLWQARQILYSLQ